MHKSQPNQQRMPVRAAPDARVLTVENLRAELGICHTTAYKLHRLGLIPFRKVMNRTVILREDVERYLASLEVLTAGPISHRRRN